MSNTWASGDTITAQKLNDMEGRIDGAGQLYGPYAFVNSQSHYFSPGSEEAIFADMCMDYDLETCYEASMTAKYILIGFECGTVPIFVGSVTPVMPLTSNEVFGMMTLVNPDTENAYTIDSEAARIYVLSTEQLQPMVV